MRKEIDSKSYNRAPKRTARTERIPTPPYAAMGPLDGLYSPDIQISAVNSTQVQVGASTGEIEFGYINGYVDVAGCLLNNASWDAISGSITNMISAFSTARGYTSTVTNTDIRNYLIASISAFSTLVAFKRYYDGKSLIDRNGVNISSLVTTRLRGISTTASVKAIVESAFIGTITESASDGDATWSSSFLTHLSRIRAPKAWFDFAANLFKGVFFIPDAAVPSYLVLSPVNMNLNSTLSVLFAADIASIDAILAKPDVLAILDFMGFDPFGLVYPFERDRRGQSLDIQVDPAILDLLGNGAWADFTSSSTDDDVSYLLYGQSDPFAPFVSETLVNYSGSSLLHLALLSRRLASAVYVMPAAYSYIVGTGFQASYMLNPVFWTAVATDGSIALNDILSRIAVARRTYDLLLSTDLGFLTEIDIAVAAGVATVGMAITTRIAEGGSTYRLPTDILFLGMTIRLSNLFGLDWRVAVQAKLATLPLSPYSGAMS